MRGAVPPLPHTLNMLMNDKIGFIQSTFSRMHLLITQSENISHRYYACMRACVERNRSVSKMSLVWRAGVPFLAGTWIYLFNRTSRQDLWPSQSPIQ
jgi:hypothetical protein